MSRSPSPMDTTPDEPPPLPPTLTPHPGTPHRTLLEMYARLQEQLVEAQRRELLSRRREFVAQRRIRELLRSHGM